MTVLEYLFDGMLGITLIWLAARAVFAKSLFGAILSFIGLGMLMALAWVRLAAPDVALAEAALGGGVTGALLIAAYNRLHHSTSDQVNQQDAIERYRLFAVLGAALVATVVATLLVWAIVSLPPASPGLSSQVSANLKHSGVQAEVTAVLLNFRSYDTLLEVSVLLVALLGVWYLGPLHLPRDTLAPGPVLDNLVRFLTPVMILVTGYIMWLGGHASGGAFQAGALLAGTGVLIRVARPEWLPLRDTRSLRGLLIAGPAVFVLVAAGMMFLTGTMLEYPRAYAGSLILLIEAASTLSIAAILTMLFSGGRPQHGADD